MCAFSVHTRKKAPRETQTLRAGCSKAEPKNFAPPQTPFPGTRDGQNFISWRWSLPLPTNPVWWGSMHTISSYRGNRPTHTPTHRQDRLQYTAPQLACSYKNHYNTISDDASLFVDIRGAYLHACVVAEREEIGTDCAVSTDWRPGELGQAITLYWSNLMQAHSSLPDR